MVQAVPATPGGSSTGQLLMTRQGERRSESIFALAALSTPGLEPVKAFQAAQTLANLFLQSTPRSQLAAAPALDAMFRALWMYQNAAGTLLLIAFARLVSEAKLVKDLPSKRGVFAPLC